MATGVLPSAKLQGRCDAICAYIAQETGVPRDQIFAKRGEARVHEARVMLIVALNRMGMTMTAIGDYLGRNHSTILHHLRRAEEDEEIQMTAAFAVGATGALDGNEPLDPLLARALRHRPAHEANAVRAYVHAALLGEEQQDGLELCHDAVRARTFVVRTNRWRENIAARELKADDVAAMRKNPRRRWLPDPEALEIVTALADTQREILYAAIAYSECDAYRGLQMLCAHPRLRQDVCAALDSSGLGEHIWRLRWHAERAGCPWVGELPVRVSMGVS